MTTHKNSDKLHLCIKYQFDSYWTNAFFSYLDETDINVGSRNEQKK